jgi:hypothetical protein
VAAARPDQAYYHAINVAFMDYAMSRNPEAAAPFALKALDYCARAERNKWQLATEGEARLMLGDADAAYFSRSYALWQRVFCWIKFVTALSARWRLREYQLLISPRQRWISNWMNARKAQKRWLRIAVFQRTKKRSAWQTCLIAR